MPDNLDAVTLSVASIETRTVSLLGEAAQNTAPPIAYLINSILRLITGRMIEIATAMRISFAQLEAILRIQWTSLEAWVVSLRIGIALYAESVRLDILTAVTYASDAILYWYRQIMVAVFDRVGELSIAIGQPACFMQNALQNARSISLATSGFLGRRFLAAEVIWLRDQAKIFDFMQNRASIYREHPSQLYADLDEIVVQNAIDAKADGQMFNMLLTERLGDVLEKAMERIHTIEDSIQKTPETALEFIEEQIELALTRFEESFEGWKAEVYNVKLSEYDQTFTILSDKIDKMITDLQMLVQIFELPGDFLFATTEFSEPERSEQLEKIAFTASRRFEQHVTGWLSEVDTHRG